MPEFAHKTITSGSFSLTPKVGLGFLAIPLDVFHSDSVNRLSTQLLKQQAQCTVSQLHQGHLNPKP